MTNSGVPYSCARSVSATPAMLVDAAFVANHVARPHIRRQPQQLFGRLRPRRATGVPGLFGVPGTGGMDVHIRSGALTPSIASPLAMTWRVAWHSARRAVCRSVGCSSPMRQHPARVVEPVVVTGEVFQVAAHPVRFPQRRRRFQHPREFADGAQQRALFVVAEQLQVCGVGDQAEFGGIAGQRRQPGMRVLHVIDRVFIGRRGPQCQIDVDGGVHRRADQAVARGIHADRLDQVVERDHGAGPLAHPDRLAVTHQVDHLPDQHLDGGRVVAERGGRRLEPGDVAVVVGAEHVDAQVETALPLVQVIGDITGDIGRVPVALDHDAVLVVTKSAGTQPACAILLVNVAVLAKPWRWPGRRGRWCASSLRGCRRRSRCRTRATTL